MCAAGGPRVAPRRACGIAGTQQLSASWAGSSAEFERLMEDSVDSAGIPGDTEVARLAPGAALVLAPPQLPESPPRDLPQPHPHPRGLPKQAVAARPEVQSPKPKAVEAPASPAVLSPAQPVGTEASHVDSVQAGERHGPVTPGPPKQVCGSGDGGAGAPPESDMSLECEDRWALAQLTGRLEDISRDLRQSVQREFVMAERALLMRCQATMAAQKQKAEVAVSHQQCMVDTLHSEKQELTRKIEQRQRKWRDAVEALQSAFLHWRVAAVEGKGAHLKEHLAGRLWQLRLLTALFAAWRRRTQLDWRERLVKHERAAAEAVHTKLLEQMEAERSHATSEAERLQRQLAEEQRQRVLLQENLKRVFMRGVCALNFEAMSLLAEGELAEQPAEHPPRGSAALSWPSSEAGERQGRHQEPPQPPEEAWLPPPQQSAMQLLQQAVSQQQQQQLQQQQAPPQQQPQQQQAPVQQQSQLQPQQQLQQPQQQLLLQLQQQQQLLLQQSQQQLQQLQQQQQQQDIQEEHLVQQQQQQQQRQWQQQAQPLASPLHQAPAPPAPAAQAAARRAAAEAAATTAVSGSQGMVALPAEEARRGPAPLPFVSYTGPPASAEAGDATASLPPPPRSGHAKDQRWQAAAAPRGAVQAVA